MRLFLWLAFGEWRAQPIRNALSVAAIAIGVALGFAVHLVNAAALESFTSGLNRVRGSADLQIRATGPAGFGDEVYAKLLAQDRQTSAVASLATSPATSAIASSIAVASPVIERDVTLIDDPAISLHISGIDALRAVRVTPALIGRPDATDDARGDVQSDVKRDAKDDSQTNSVRSVTSWFDPDALFVTPALLDAIHKKVGDAIALQVDGERIDLRIAGRLSDDDEQNARASLSTASSSASSSSSSSNPPKARRVFRASMDIAGAQWRLNRLGRLSRIDLRLVEAADAASVRAAIAAWLPRDAQIASADDDRSRTGDLSRAYRVNLDMLALMALFTGAFLVYSTQSLAVARRRAQLALLRVVGVVRQRVVVQVLAEGAMQGVVGGLLGLLAGVGFAAAALRWFGGDLGGGYFASRGEGFALDLRRLLFASPEGAALFFMLGLVAALVGSYLPARAAVSEAPAIALKSAGSDVGRGRASPRIGTALVIAGVGCAFVPAIGGLPIAGYLAMGLLLFGGIAAMPWVAQRVLAPIATGHGRYAIKHAIAIDLALKRLWAAPSAAAVALCGIVASASLMVAMTVMIASFRHSLDAWLGDLLSADLYLRTNSSEGNGLGPDDVERLRHVDGIARIDVQKALQLSLAPARPPVTLIARTVGTDDPHRSLPLVEQSSTVPRDGAIPIWVSEAMVDLYAYAPGRRVALPLGDQPAATRYLVAGVWRDYARQFGSIAIRSADYTRVTGDERFSDAAMQLAPGVSAAMATERLRAALPERLRARAEFAEPAAIRKISLAIFDRSFAVTYLLQAVAIAIGLAGVAATFSAQTLARAKEFGMLRHIGVQKRQIVGELAAEGALLGTLGAISGGVLGAAISQVLIHVVNPQSFHWTMDTEVPWRTLAAVGLALIVASAGTAVISGRRAMARDAVLAVREDW